MHRFVTALMIPVPVGHRVEITWFVERGHRVLDLDTGVEYDDSEHYVNVPGSRPQRVVDLTPNPALVTQGSLRGIVRRCVVTQIGQLHQTLLVVEPDAGPPYR